MQEKIVFENMVDQLAKPGDAILNSLSASRCHLLHMAIGICGEVGELVLAAFNSDRENIVEELGDIEFYLEGFFQGLNCNQLSLSEMPDPYPRMLPIQSLPIISADLLDVTKKLVIYDKQNDHTFHELTEAAMKMRKVLDLYYAEPTFFQNPITREEAIQANISKLGKRYLSFKYSDKSAQERADKVGE